MWAHKECGGRVIGVFNEVSTKDYSLKIDGSEGKCLKKYTPDTYLIGYSCSKCGKYYNSNVKLRDIAEWK